MNQRKWLNAPFRKAKVVKISGRRRLIQDEKQLCFSSLDSSVELLTQSCQILCDPMDYRMPGFPQFSSVQFSLSVVSDSLQPPELQHARPSCPSPTPRVHPNSCALSRWCHLAISSSVIPLSSCPQSLPASGSFPLSQVFAWGGQSIGVSASASVLPMNTQDWSPLGWTGWTSWNSSQP